MPQELDLSILERVADYGFAQGPAVGFLANWRKQPSPGPSNTGIRPQGVGLGLWAYGPMGLWVMYHSTIGFSNFRILSFTLRNLGMQAAVGLLKNYACSPQESDRRCIGLNISKSDIRIKI